MVESAIVFPLVILAVFSAIYILIALYTEAVTQGELHGRLRREAGLSTETVLFQGTELSYVEDIYAIKARSGYFTIDEQGQIWDRRLYGNASMSARDRGLLRKTFSKEIRGRVYVLDEAAYIRWVSLTTKREP